MMLNQSSRSGRWRPSPDLIASLILVGIGILFFFDFFFSSKNFYFRDILNFHYPLRKVLIDSYSRGEFPLWNPFIYLGQPMLANPNYMAFYPTNLLHLFLPFDYAFKLHFIIHPILAGLGAYFFMRRLNICFLAALTGSLAYEFSGAVLSFLNLYNLVPTVALLPWIGWAFWGALRERWLKRSLIFGALLALQIISVEPLLFQCVIWMLAGLSILYVLEAKEWKKALLVPVRVSAAGVVFSLGLAAIQVLPTLELLPRSARGKLDFLEVCSWSMHPLDFLNTMVPNLFGNFYTIGFSTSWGGSIHHGREGYLVSFFLGTCTILLAIVSFTSNRKKLRLILLSLAAISIFLALGKYNPVYHWLYQHVPFFSFGRYPSKYFLLSTLIICIMASLGVEVLLDRRERPTVKRCRIIAIAGLLLAGFFLFSSFYFKVRPLTLENWLRYEIGAQESTSKDFPGLIAHLRQSLLSSGVFFLFGSVVVLSAFSSKAGFLLKGFLPILVAIEMIPANLRLSPLISDADFKFVPEINKYLGKLVPGETYRVVPPTFLKPESKLGLSMRAPNRSMAWLTLFYKMTGQPFHGIINGIQYSLDRTVDHLNTLEADVLWRTFTGLSEASNLTLFSKLNSPVILSVEEINDSRVRLLSKFETWSDLTVRVYWLDNTVKRAYFASGFDYASSQKEALKRFLDAHFPVGTTVILEGQGGSKAAQMNAGTVSIVEYRNSRVVCNVDAKTQGYLVLLDTYYPGWIARIDGKETKVLRANYAFRAVQVSAGKHTVEFSYRPVLFYVGFVVSSFFLLAGCAAAVVEHSRSQKAQKQ